MKKSTYIGIGLGLTVLFASDGYGNEDRPHDLSSTSSLLILQPPTQPKPANYNVVHSARYNQLTDENTHSRYQHAYPASIHSLVSFVDEEPQPADSNSTTTLPSGVQQTGNLSISNNNTQPRASYHTTFLNALFLGTEPVDYYDSSERRNAELAEAESNMRRYGANSAATNTAQYEIAHSSAVVTTVTNGTNSWSGPSQIPTPFFVSPYHNQELSRMSYAERFSERSNNENRSGQGRPYPLQHSAGMRFLSSGDSIKLTPYKASNDSTLTVDTANVTDADIPPTVSLRDFMTQVISNMGEGEYFYYTGEDGTKWIIENGNALAALTQGTMPMDWSTDLIAPVLLTDAWSLEALQDPEETTTVESRDHVRTDGPSVSDTVNPASKDLAAAAPSSTESAAATPFYRLFGYAISKASQEKPTIVKVRREAS